MGIGIKACSNQGDGPFWGPDRGYNKGKFVYLKNIPLTNQWPEYIAILYDTTLGQGDSSLCK